MTTFYINTRFMYGDTDYSSGTKGFFCRELATNHITAGFDRDVEALIRARLSTTYDGLDAFYILCLQSKPVSIDLDVLFNKNNWDRVSLELREEVRAFIAQHYPTVTMQLHDTCREHTQSFVTFDIQGYTLSGDASVIPAFFWSVLIFRSAIDNHRSTLSEALESEFATEYDNMGYPLHKKAHERLLAGTEPPALWMLALSNGPIDTWEEQKYIQAQLDMLDKNGNMTLFKEIIDAVS